MGDRGLPFFICIAGCFFFLAERCRQPLATLRERLHLSARATLLLHFVLELADKGIKFEKKDAIVSDVKTKALKTRGDIVQYYWITGIHSNALTQSNTISRIDMTYTPPRTPSVTITGSSISSNYSGMTWTPDDDNPKEFSFSGRRCDISLKGTIRYKPFYSGKQIMAGYVTKSSRGYLDGGKVERLH